MKTTGTYTRFARIAIVSAAAGLLLAATAAPALAGPAVGVDREIVEQAVVGNMLEFTAIHLPPLPEEQVITDGGTDETHWPDEVQEDVCAGDAEESQATPTPEEPRDEAGDQQVPEQSDQSQETTPTDEPETPDEPDDDTPSLPFTGGDATPYVIGGLLLALAGVGVLIARRHVYDRM